MQSIVPISGYEVLNQIQLDHVIFHIEKMGHQPFCLDDWNSLHLLKLPVEKTRIPFFIQIVSSTKDIIEKNTIGILLSKFNSAAVITEIPKELPNKLVECHNRYSLYQSMHVPECIEASIRYIVKRLEDEVLDVGSIIRVSGTNRNKLEELFRNYFGQGVWQHVIALRVAEAKRLLLETEMPISHIGMAVGIADSALFSHTFRKKTLMSASEYRKQHRISRL